MFQITVWPYLAKQNLICFKINKFLIAYYSFAIYVCWLLKLAKTL